MTSAEPQPNSLEISLPITIRPATRTDIPLLEMDGLFVRFRNLFRRAYRDMQRGKRLLLIADCNDAVIGRLFILFKSSDSKIADGRRRAYLYSFYMLSPFRGMGLGTQMMHYAENLLQDRGFRTITIAVAKDNMGALRLYKRLGYRVLRADEGQWSYTDHRGRVHHMNEPCWILEKTLSSL